MRSRSPRTVVLPNAAEAAALVKKMRGEIDGNENYRTKSLKIFGPVCAKCGREFDQSNLKLLTVHHRDGNHQNNPPDGSNWENLCIHCHDDEHSREILGDYLSAENIK
ncbi:MAG: YajD family HNH nuclease [Desulfuromonadaceae bacterium]|nr:YajD family HNH nuclease [Desulfuromonadaceae bacterium]MDD2854212.1 YajD family HNH nuclease [Desulfuromonadaceae bacterium]